MSHPCPARVRQGKGEPRRCIRPVPDDQFACKTDWFRLPKEIRRRIWRYWENGDVDEHAKAMLDAVTWYERNPR